MTISIIVAYAENRVIGRDNTLLWHLPDDLKRFKRLTMGHHIIMGRKTWESIGRPLPGRTNVVISGNRELEIPGVKIFHSLGEALNTAENQGEDEAFVIGGGEIYRQALPSADKLYLTVVTGSDEGDTYFPEIDPEEWQILHREFHPRDEKHARDFEMIELSRRVT